jgi:hypothetical protein
MHILFIVNKKPDNPLEVARDKGEEIMHNRVGKCVREACQTKRVTGRYANAKAQ